jgi:cellulose 1,4-beta-cellobiosidase
MRPTTNTSQLGLDIIDALVWVKTPGESDGTSNQSAKRHDQHCNSPDSFIPSPEAGFFSSPIYDMLVKNANPPLTANELSNKIKFDTPQKLSEHVT